MSARRAGSLLTTLVLGTLLALLTTSCGDDDVSYQLVTFNASAGGLARPAAGPLVLHTAMGWDVSLTAAQVSIQAMYFHNAVPDDSPIAYDGIAVAEVLGAFVVDALDPQAYPIPGGGKGFDEPAMAGEVRFGPAPSGPIAAGGMYAIAYVAGTAVRNGVTVAFAGTIDLGDDPNESDYQGVADRRLSYLAAAFTAEDGGTLTLRVDPTSWFDQVSFDALGPAGAAATDTHDFDTTVSAQQFRNGWASAPGAFTFTWVDAQ